MNITQHKSHIEVSDFGQINLELTLDCGQAFRWEPLPDGSFYGIADSRETRVKKEEDALLFFGTSEEDVRDFWVNYFDLTDDYDEILSRLCRDEKISLAHSMYGTIRLLNQPPFETLCSFIISACNNIPRIKSIIKTLCESFGEKCENGYSFPSACMMASLNEDDLSVIRAGYRVPYLLDAARKVADGEIDFDKIRSMNEDEARKELMKIKGVGKKVADCTLLFSLGFKNCYPVDRHIARADALMYPDGLPDFFSGNKGLAQQYIFHYQRTYTNF